MSMSKTLGCCLLGLVLFLLPAATLGATPAEAAAEENPATVSAESVYVVFYLHGTRRCRTCRTIEEEADRAVHRFYDGPLDRGTMEWRVVNMEKKENRHFVTDFGLVASSLVIAEVQEGKAVRFEVLGEVWKLTSDSMRFAKYVKDSIDEFMAPER